MINRRQDHRRTPKVFYYVHPATKAASIRSSKTGRQTCSRLSNYNDEEDNLSHMIKSYEKENKSMLLPQISKFAKHKKWLQRKENCLREYSEIAEKIRRLNKNKILAKQTLFKCQVNRIKNSMSPSQKYL